MIFLFIELVLNCEFAIESFLLGLNNKIYMIYEYGSVRVIIGSGILGFGFNLGQIDSGRNRVGFKMGTVRVGFRLSIFGSLRFGSLRFGFELGRIITGVGNFGSHYNSGFAQLRISLLRVFGSKSFILFWVSIRVWIRIVRFGF